MDHSSPPSGVSVILCCHNSAERLLPTLTALSKQVVEPSLKWEIILVDNASTDDTVFISNKIWNTLPDKPDIAFRVFYESRAGQNYARKRALSKSTFQYIVFCDDDNWLNINYIQDAYNILKSDDLIAACGGLGLPVFESKKPSWFDHYAEAFAVGSQSINNARGKILNLYGAGLALNLNAFRNLENSGFEPLMNGRAGNSLGSSDDTELTYALVLMGYTLHYEPKLVFQHFLTQKRLSRIYLTHLFKAFGKDGPVRNLYYARITKRFPHRLIRFWPLHLLLAIFRMGKYLISPPKKNGRKIYYTWSCSYIRELFSIRGIYPSIVARINSIRPQIFIVNKSGTLVSTPQEEPLYHHSLR